MLPKISAALSQFVKPITASNTKSEVARREDGFRRESPPREQPKKKDPVPDNVVPFPQKSSPAGVAEKTFGSAILSLLTSLRPQREFLADLGRKLYMKVLRDQRKNRVKKGTIFDRRA